MLIIVAIVERRLKLMSKAQDLEDMQEFVNEYENIKDTLESLLDETNNKELREEVNGLLSVLEEDYEQQNKDFTERIAEMENEEENYLERQYYSMKL
jgi:hypothetical protein|nr:MAG TPA: hypothetical protein [Caudoviricetes sp.]